MLGCVLEVRKRKEGEAERVSRGGKREVERGNIRKIQTRSCRPANAIGATREATSPGSAPMTLAEGAVEDIGREVVAPSAEEEEEEVNLCFQIHSVLDLYAILNCRQMLQM